MMTLTLSAVMLHCRSSDAYVSFRCANPVEFRYPLRSLVLGMKVSEIESFGVMYGVYCCDTVVVALCIAFL